MIMTTETCDVVVAGHICLDIIPSFSSRSGEAELTLVPGHMVEVGPGAVSTGGAVPNTGLTLHKLGMRVRLLGKIGDDLFGHAVLDRLAATGLGESMIVDPIEPTSYTLVVAPPGVDRMFLYCAGANDHFCAEDVRYHQLAGARLFHLGYPPLMRRLYNDGGDQLTEIFRRARSYGVTTSLDMALPDADGPGGRVDWLPILERVLPYVDYFLPSAEETLFMLDRRHYDELSARRSNGDLLRLFEADVLSDLSSRLLALGPAIVALKCGYRGFYLRTADEARLTDCVRGRVVDPANWANRELWEPSFQVQVASATGSGDSSIAGFLTALLRGYSVEKTLRMACAVGGYNVEVLDAVSGICSWEETLDRIGRGWPKNPLEIHTPGWRQDESGLFHGPADRPA